MDFLLILFITWLTMIQLGKYFSTNMQVIDVEWEQIIGTEAEQIYDEISNGEIEIYKV